MTREEAKQRFDRIREETLKENSRSLRGSLKLWAEELNTKETHFILELIQNAEDNAYEVPSPELSLRVESSDPTNTPLADGCLVVLNNEVGFRPENVRSLCSVGQSTKSDRSHGYIGEKGIGFKSVFRVTDSPHIFSNGFQFRFQVPTEPEELGYILPHWVEHPPTVVAGTGTSILLPLKPGKKTLIEQQLTRIAPETILFLQKLKSFTVSNGLSITREDRSGSVVTLRKGGEESTYFVHDYPRPKPEGLVEDKRPGVCERRVTVALPLRPAVSCKGRIFAFLPTEFDSGLPFLTNADFILNSNRERVLEDRSWNQWLRNEIGPTFIQAFHLLLDNAEWKTEAHRFLPEVALAADFVRPVAEFIQTRLQSMPCVLTDALSVELPTTVFVPGPLARRVLCTVPRGRLNFALLHSAWEDRWQERLKPLGVRSLTFAQIFEACNEADWLGSRDVEWWETILELCTKCDVSAQTIGSFPLLRCQDGKCRPLSNGVFLHPDGQPTIANLLPEWPPAHFFDAELQRHLRQEEVHQHNEQWFTETPKVWAWLTRVAGLRPFSVQTYITNQLLNWMREQNGEQGAKRLVEATRFVAANLNSLDKQAQQALRAGMPWLLADNRVLRAESRAGKELVTPECLEGVAGWSRVFDPGNDRLHFWVLHNAYFEGQPEAVKAAVLKLMKEVCGATGVPDPAKLNHPSGYVDWAAPAWLRSLNLLQPPENLELRISALEGWIGCFKDGFVKFLVLGDGENAWNHPPANSPSQLGTALRTRRWLRSTKKLVTPPAGYADDPEIRDFLQESVPYVLAKLSPELLGKLGVHLRLSAETLLDLLRQMRESGDVDKALVVRVYRRLQTMAFDSDVFRTEQLVFLDTPEVRWMPTERVFWADAGPVFDAQFGYAAPTYEHEELHSFFTGKLGILDGPDARGFAEVWAHLPQAAPDTDEKMQARFAMILPKVAEAVTAGSPPDWWGALRLSLKVWTTAKQFVNPQIAFTPDDALAEQLFFQTAPIAWTPTTRVNGLLRSLGCRSLAAALRSGVANAVEPLKAEGQRLLTSASKELLVCWVCNSEGWSKHQQNLEQLLRTEEWLVNQLAVEHWLDGASVPKETRDVDAFWDANDKRLYLRQGATTSSLQVATAASIAARFNPTNKQAKDTVRCLLGLEPGDGERELAERKLELSPKQREWLNSLELELTVLKAMPAQGGHAPRTARPGTTPVTVPANTSNQRDATGKNSGEQQSSTGSRTACAQEADSAANQTAPTATGQSRQEPPRSNTATTGEAGKERAASGPTVEFRLKETTHGFSVRAGQRGEENPTARRERLSVSSVNEEPSHSSATSASESLSPEQKKRIEERGREFAVKHLREELGYAEHEVKPLLGNHPGFDVLAERNGKRLRIEIKAHLRGSKVITLTVREFREHARWKDSEPNDRWELWNIEHLAGDDTEEPTITIYKDIPEDAVEAKLLRVDLRLCN